VGAQSIYVCAQIAGQQPEMSVSYVSFLTACGNLLGSAWHGSSGEAGVGLGWLQARKGVDGACAGAGAGAGACMCVAPPWGLCTA